MQTNSSKTRKYNFLPFNFFFSSFRDLYNTKFDGTCTYNLYFVGVLFDVEATLCPVLMSYLMWKSHCVLYSLPALLCSCSDKQRPQPSLKHVNRGLIYVCYTSWKLDSHGGLSFSVVGIKIWKYTDNVHFM